MMRVEHLERTLILLKKALSLLSLGQIKHLDEALKRLDYHLLKLNDGYQIIEPSSLSDREICCIHEVKKNYVMLYEALNQCLVQSTVAKKKHDLSTKKIMKGYLKSQVIVSPKYIDIKNE